MWNKAGTLCIERYSGPRSYSPMGVVVGGSKCQTCNYFRGRSESGEYVNCNYREDIRDKIIDTDVQRSKLYSKILRQAFLASGSARKKVEVWATLGILAVAGTVATLIAWSVAR